MFFEDRQDLKLKAMELKNGVRSSNHVSIPDNVELEQLEAIFDV